MLKIKIILLTTFFFFNTFGQKNFTIMLNPAGDATHTGRVIDNSFERGLTLQFAEQLKKTLEQLYPNIRVLLTRFAGERIQPLQQANFANRTQADLFLSLHLYQSTTTKPEWRLYHFSYGNTFVTKKVDLAFYPYDQAHLINFETTKEWINLFANNLKQEEYNRLFTIKGVHTLPFKPLIGVVAPAIAIEMGLKQKSDWHNYLMPIAQSLQSIITFFYQ